MIPFLNLGLGLGLPSPTSPAGLMLYGPVGLLVALTVVERLRNRQDSPSLEGATSDTDGPQIPEATSESPEGDPEQAAPEVDMASLFSIEEQQQSVLAPEAIEWDTRTARLPEEWTTTLYVPELPDGPVDGYLSELINLTGVKFDVTIHLSRYPHETARAKLETHAEEQEARAAVGSSTRQGYLQQQADLAKTTHNAVENGEQVFEQSIFVTVRADTEEELREQVQTVKRVLRAEPAHLTPKVAVANQRPALQSAAPVGGEHLTERGHTEHTHIALGGAVGALLASLHNPTILEEGGVEFGIHRDTRTPIVIDPFEREDGYAMFVVGQPGSGKSFASKQNFIRSIEQREDRIGVILEPLGNWAGVAAALDAERFEVTGDTGLNPLEIREPPAHVLDERDDPGSLLAERIELVVSFLTNFLQQRADLGDQKVTLERAVREAYERAGITADPATHSRESPTMETLFDVLENMAESPGEYVVRSEREAERVASQASWLLNQLQAFAPGGSFANLGRHSEFDIHDEKVLYLDLREQGGAMSQNVGLMMELLISLVYERAKETEKEVVFYIDESRYLMQDAATLEFLETIFRHHRHHDLSIRLVTQTIDEFLASDQAEMILDQCAIKQFHRLEGMDDQIAAKFGLNDHQKEFVQNATPGSERHGYSKALVGIDGEFRAIEVQALPREQEVIDFDPRRDTDLGGGTETDPQPASGQHQQSGSDEGESAGAPQTQETDSSTDSSGQTAPAASDANDTWGADTGSATEVDMDPPSTWGCEDPDPNSDAESEVSMDPPSTWGCEDPSADDVDPATENVDPTEEVDMDPPSTWGCEDPSADDEDAGTDVNAGVDEGGADPDTPVVDSDSAEGTTDSGTEPPTSPGDRSDEAPETATGASPDDRADDASATETADPSSQSESTSTGTAGSSSERPEHVDDASPPGETGGGPATDASEHSDRDRDETDGDGNKTDRDQNEADQDDGGSTSSTTDGHRGDAVLMVTDPEWTPQSVDEVLTAAVSIDRVETFDDEEKDRLLKILYVQARDAGLDVTAAEIKEEIKADRSARQPSSPTGPGDDATTDPAAYAESAYMENGHDESSERGES